MLINAHTHLELSGLAHMVPTVATRFGKWLSKVGRKLHRRNAVWFRESCELGIQQLLAAGTTHVGDISWSGESVEPLVRSGLEGIVWLEMRGSALSAAEARFKWLQQEVDRLRQAVANSAIELGIEMHAPYSVHPLLWEPILHWIDQQRLPLCIHAAESPGEWELFRHATGELCHFEGRMAMSAWPLWLRRVAARLVNRNRTSAAIHDRVIPRDEDTTPVSYLEQMGALKRKPLLVHMVQVTDDDIERVRRCGSTVVHCPRSNQLLGCGRMPLEKMIAAGIPVLLGTDSLASSPTLDVRDEVKAAKTMHRGSVGEDCLEALARDKTGFQSLGFKWP